MLEELDKILKVVDGYLRRKLKVRDEVILASRQAIRLCGEAISSIHRGEWDRVRELITQAEELLAKLDEVFKSYPDLYYGDAHTAFQEFFEAKLLMAALGRGDVPEIEGKERYYQALALGMADLIGELRREALEKLIAGDYEGAERVCRLMEDIYVRLWRLEYPRALVPGLRQKIDIARRLIDDTKRILAEASIARSLREAVC